MIEDIYRARLAVIDWRKDSEDVFPWPSDKDCIAFALTELGEAMDALLLENTEYLRNNPEAKAGHSVHAELGDALFMLLSLHDELELYPMSLSSGKRAIDERTIADIMRRTAELLMKIDCISCDDFEEDLTHALSLFFLIEGFSPILTVYGTITKLSVKHLKRSQEG